MKGKTIKAIHRWLAFILGLFIVFQITSGSIAQESRLLMQWSNPDHYKVESNREPAGPTEIKERMRELEPDFNIAHVMVPPPNRESTAYILMGGRNPENLHESSLFVNYDQYQQKILDEHPLAGSGWIGTMTVLHRWIVFGEAGFYVVFILGLATVLMSISGIYLFYRTRATAKHLPVINRLHRSLGFVASFFLIVTSLSGIAMSYVHWQDRGDNLSVFANMMKTDHMEAGHMTSCLQSLIQILRSLKQDQLSLKDFISVHILMLVIIVQIIGLLFLISRCSDKMLSLRAHLERLSGYMQLERQAKGMESGITYCQYTAESILDQLAAS